MVLSGVHFIQASSRSISRSSIGDPDESAFLRLSHRKAPLSRSISQPDFPVRLSASRFLLSILNNVIKFVYHLYINMLSLSFSYYIDATLLGLDRKQYVC